MPNKTLHSPSPRFADRELPGVLTEITGTAVSTFVVMGISGVALGATSRGLSLADAGDRVCSELT
jgi:hypothetical protein